MQDTPCTQFFFRIVMSFECVQGLAQWHNSYSISREVEFFGPEDVTTCWFRAVEDCLVPGQVNGPVIGHEPVEVQPVNGWNGSMIAAENQYF
ncbi:unnamed protein product [Haemonchus placei]|uniref:Monooxygenase n=1 Tax=Haemonchus placei TaxID=6290 RepID=A0A0N4WIU2_HAEPC|nr:unnamed protein product [Haemonchus placei]